MYMYPGKWTKWGILRAHNELDLLNHINVTRTVLFKDRPTFIRIITINWSRQLTGPSAATCMALWWVSCDAQTRFSESSHAYQQIYSMRSPSRLVGQAMFSLVSIFSILYMQNIPIFYCSYWRHHDLAPSRQDVDSAVLDQRAKHEDHAREHPDVDRLDVGHSAIVTHSNTWRERTMPRQCGYHPRRLMSKLRSTISVVAKNLTMELWKSKLSCKLTPPLYQWGQ